VNVPLGIESAIRNPQSAIRNWLTRRQNHNN
jgi:hypothetical protein